MEIRQVRADEFAALAALTVAAYEELFDEPLADYELELRDVEGRAADSHVLVAVDDDGTVLGGVTFVPGSGRAMSEFDDEDGAGIRMLAVDPRAQGRGIGRALATKCVALARKAGVARVVLHSTSYMVAAQRCTRAWASCGRLSVTWPSPRSPTRGPSRSCWFRTC